MSNRKAASAMCEKSWLVGVTRTMAAVNEERGKSHEYVGRSTFVFSSSVHLGFLARANFDRFLAQLRDLLQKLEF